LAKEVTIQDIAKKLNLTTATVSRALNNHPRISEKTKQAVKELAEKLNYRRNRIASSLRSGKTYIIGVVIPSVDVNFFGSVVHGIESLANEYGYNVIIYQTNETEKFEKKGIETFLSTKVDGVLASIAKNTEDFAHFIEVKNSGLPLVFFDRVNDALNIPSVVIDDYKGAYYATEHLIQQGYKRIAHVSGPPHLKIVSDRLQGYKAALKQHNIAFDKQLVFVGDVSVEAGKKAVDYYFNLPHPPDAVFAVEDFTALGVLKAIKLQKLRVPQEFGVIGFANEGFGEHITPSLSTVDQQSIEMGKEAFKLLIELIEEKGTKKQTKSKVVLEPVLIYRQSSLRKKS
jgi:LacI family transcriptional regulator